MYHFTFIDEASTIAEQERAKAQESATKSPPARSNQNQHAQEKTARFLKMQFRNRSWFNFFSRDH